MWTYQISAGAMLDPFGNSRGICYSGKGKGLNNPAYCDVHGGCRWNGSVWVPVPALSPDDWGPLPIGIYTRQLPPVDTTTHGPFVIWLTPDPSNVMFGRSEFGEHGDEVNNVGKFLASEGCIIEPHTLRLLESQSTDIQLQVTA